MFYENLGGMWGNKYVVLVKGIRMFFFIKRFLKVLSERFIRDLR